MSYIRYKRFGNKEYAYEVTSYWDPKKKTPRQKVRYIGVVDRDRNLIERPPARKEENLILDFGDTYLLYEFMKRMKLLRIMEGVFGEHVTGATSLMCYRLCHPSAMRYAKLWHEGNISRFLFKGTDLSSQRISEFLSIIGNETLQRKFFTHYVASLPRVGGGVIIDATALPNQIHLPFNAWGYHDGEIDKQIRFLFVIDKDTSLPLFFRYVPGNIVDVSSLNVTVEELDKIGIKHSFVLIDAGFFSEDNIKELYRNKIDFLTRLPSMRTLFKELIKKETRTLERFEHAVRYGKRALFVKQKNITLYGKQAYAYIVLDPERKGRETRKLILQAMEGDEDDVEYKLMKKGVMILVSSFTIDAKDIVPFYYLRQTVETLFGFSKDDLKLLPLRIHKEETLRGYLLLIFLALTVFLTLKKEIGQKHTVEEVLFTMRNLKCKVYDDEILVQELTKQQKEIAEALNIIVPKKLGV
jgi:transposase